jgi:hypothetical protein
VPIVHIFSTNIFRKNTTKNVSNVTYQTFNKINTEVFKNVIKTLSWNSILDEINDPVKALCKIFVDVYEANFPLK